ncbi:uncharacterized protein [Procambarus clarkii]|uniref:uncharacterized protein n=1 Tax=Procambarus clarkii TaxID=6728 RepID=UPI003744485B
MRPPPTSFRMSSNLNQQYTIPPLLSRKHSKVVWTPNLVRQVKRAFRIVRRDEDGRNCVRRGKCPPLLLTLCSTIDLCTPNTSIRKVDAMHCKAKYCSLLGADKQRRCCDVYSQCCAYANVPHSNNPFYFEKNPVNY